MGAFVNLPALSAEIVKRVLESAGDSNHNVATTVQHMIAEAMAEVKQKAAPVFHIFSTPEELREFRFRTNAVDDANNANKLRIENAQLRQAIVTIVDNLNNGSKVSPDASLDFLCNAVPNEVKLTIELWQAKVQGALRE